MSVAASEFVHSVNPTCRGCLVLQPTHQEVGLEQPPLLLDHGFVIEQVEIRLSWRLPTLGLVPEGTDLQEVLLGLYDEQVAAFYVPEERALYTFKDTSFSGNLDRVTLAGASVEIDPGTGIKHPARLNNRRH